MSKFLKVVVFICGVTLLMAGLALAQEKAPAKPATPPVKPTPKYIGVDKCKMCHKMPIYGNQFGVWEKSKHAQAYKVLASPKAIEVGKKLEIAEPQKSPKCLKCHVTGYEADAKLKDASLKMEEGIGCEACHGPGSEYKAMSVMKNREVALKVGLIVPDEKTCTKCHNQESPTFKEFKFKEMLAMIAHPVPKKQEKK